MAIRGGGGTGSRSGGAKFASVNLSRSYGRPTAVAVPSGRSSASRPPSQSGMVVLSRSSLGPSKGARLLLAVPPPINLPSLQREHSVNNPTAPTDSTSGGGGAGGTAALGVAGWSKQKNESSSGPNNSDPPFPGRVINNVYAPPGARKGTPETVNQPPRSLQKAVVLKGEDFPSLKAATTVPPPFPPKQRLAQQPRLQEKSKQSIPPPPIPVLTPTSTPTPTPTPKQLSRGETQTPDRSIATSDSLRRPFNPPTAPLVRLARSSDWDDDERVTSHTLRSHSGTSVPPPPMRANGLWKSGFNRDVNGLPPPNEPYRGRGGNFDRDYTDRTGCSDGHGRVELNRREGLGKDSSYGSGSSQQQNSFHGQSPGYSPGGFGNYFRPSSEEKGRKSQQQQQQRSFRPDSSRDAWRTSAKSFSVKPSYIETSSSFLLSDGFSTDLMDQFRIDVRVIRKRKEGSEKVSMRDPERESFEAELEQVQNMLEQERQRMAEEREMAVEMARREQEEQERRVREEEELRLKREEEAREAVLEMEREAIEAGMRAEAERRTREDQRCRALLEEERRKESARRKLLELEERIAKREEEEEWKRQQEKQRNQEQVATTWEDREHNHPFYAVSRAEPDDDECASLRPRSPPSLRGSSDATYSRPTSSETMSYRADEAASRTSFNWRGEPVDNNGHSSYPSSLLNGVVPLRESFRGTSKVLPHTSESISQRQETSSRRIRSLYSNEHGSNTKEDLYYSSRNSSNISPRYSMDNSYEREGDYKWDRGGKNRPSSTSFSSHLPGAEYRDLLPTSRSRLKQPHVPPPLIQAPVWRPPRRAENEEAHGYGSSSQPRAIFGDRGAEETGSEADVEVDKGVERGVVVVAVAEEVPIEQDVICEESERDSQNSSPVPFESAFDETCNRGIAVQMVGASEESQSSHMENEESGNDASFQEDWVVEGAEQDDYENEEAADEETDVKSTSPGYEEDAEEKVITEDQVDRNDTRDHLEPCPSSPCLTKDAADKDHPLEEEEKVRVEDHSGLNNHGSLFLSNPLEPVQLRQPFPFMAVPLPPQSNTNNAVTQQASVLPPNHGLQSQPDIPFQLRFGLLPGTTLMPSAIQIGSIQMPLHLHTQVPQLAPSLHAPQPPLFQFGQIGHSGPFSQPPLFPPPPMHIHHSGSQISHSQSYNSDSSIYSSANEEMQIAGQGGGGALHHETQNLNLSRLEHSSNKEMVSDNLCTGISGIVEQVPADQAEVSIVNRDQETSSKQINGESHLEMRRKASNTRFGKTNGFDEPLEFDDGIEVRNGERVPLSRPGRRSFRRAEFKPKEDPFLDEHSSDITSSGSKHLQATGGFVGSNSKNFLGRDAQFDQERMMMPNRSSFIDDRMSLGGAVSTQFGQNGGKGNRASVIKRPVIASNVGLPSHPRLSDGNSKSYVGSAATSDVPLQSGLDCVFEQPGIDTRSTEDSFTEVRSKQHMLNDKRDQREKEIKTWNKDSKISDRGLHKLSQKSISTASKMSNVQSVEKRLSLHRPDIEAASLDMRQSPSGAMSQAQSINSVQLLGAAAGGSHDAPDKKLKGSRSVQGNLVVGSNWISSTDGSTSESHYAAVLDNAANSTNAWGGQQSVHQVVGLTQIHLEEVLKPASLEGSLSQKSSLSERTAPVREKFTAAVPGPIGSLLAGEKIQFGAVTSPPIMLSDPHSHVPSTKLPATSSSLSTDAKDVKCQRENTEGSVENVSLRSKQARLDEDKPRDSADVEGKFAASAVAATTSNESIGNACRTDMRHGSLARMTTSVPGSSFDKSVGCSNSDVLGVIPTAVEDSVALSLPADLSVEAPSSTSRVPLHSAQTSPGLMLPPFSSGVSHPPCLEMGTMLSGQPFFSLAPCEDALSMSQQGIKPVPSFSGHGGGMGLASVGWQQRHSTGVDSFYSGQPSGFPGTFINPGSGVPGIQGPPHMLVYTNPFASVGQFGQLGLGFMGTAYLPSGKQPDWTHTPTVTSTSQGETHVGDGELRNSVGGGIASQPCSSVINNGQHQHAGLGGSSVMPVSPLNLYDFSLSNPYQMANRDAMMESQWSYVPAQPLQSVPLSGPLMGHLMQSWNLGGLPNQIPAPQMAQMNPGLHPFSLAQPHNGSSNNTFLSADSAACFPDELGLDDSVSSNMGSLGPRSPNGEPGVSGAPGISKLQQNTRSLRGGNNLFNSNVDDNGNAMMDVGMVSSLSVSHNDSTLPASEVHSFPSTHRVGYDEDRFPSPQSMARMNTGNEWPGGAHRKGPVGQASTPDRTSFGEKPFPLQPKVKQVYVAKHVASSL